MEIRNTGGPGIPTRNGWRRPAVEVPEEPFRLGRSTANRRTPRVESADRPPSPSVEYTRADLADAAKREVLIRGTIGEMLEREFPAARELSASQKQFLTDWMARDPILREKAGDYLGRILG